MSSHAQTPPYRPVRWLFTNGRRLGGGLLGTKRHWWGIGLAPNSRVVGQARGADPTGNPISGGTRCSKQLPAPQPHGQAVQICPPALPKGDAPCVSHRGSPGSPRPLFFRRPPSRPRVGLPALARDRRFSLPEGVPPGSTIGRFAPFLGTYSVHVFNSAAQLLKETSHGTHADFPLFVTMPSGSRLIIPGPFRAQIVTKYS